MELKNLQLDLEKNREDILNKIMSTYDVEVIKTWNVDKLNTELIDTLCFSFLDIIAHCIEENAEESCFKDVIKSDRFSGNVDMYIEHVAYSGSEELPFSNKEPYQLFEVLNNFSESIINELKVCN